MARAYCRTAVEQSATEDQATLRVTPILEGGRAGVECWATFDCEAGARDESVGAHVGSFEKWLEKWLESLPDTLTL